MITDQDITTLKKTFATQESLDRLTDTVDGIQEQVGDIKVELGEIRETLDSLDVKFDGMIGLLEASMQEHGAGAAHLARHDRQIGALAAATSTNLPD